MSEPTIQVEQATVFYGEVVGLSRVTLSARPGILGLVGPNGSGKSTLIRVLTGCMASAEGRVRVLGQDPFTHASARQRIALVPTPECFSLLHTGRENAELAWLARGADRKQAADGARRTLEVAGLLADADRSYGAWSRGMRQRLKVGLALGFDADIVLLDEPYLGVDPPNRRRLRDLVVSLAEQGRTVLLASHVLTEVQSVTREIAVLMHGRLLGLGDVDDLMAALRDRHPHRIRVSADRPRALAAALVGLEHVARVEMLGDTDVELLSTRPDVAYRELARAIASTQVVVRQVRSDDDSLDAVFRSLTEAGARHLRDVTSE